MPIVLVGALIDGKPNYMTAAYALESTGIGDRITKDSIIVNTVGQYNFPAGSGEFFTGAVATWTVTEDDPPNE